MNFALVSATQIVHHSFPALRDWAFVQRWHNRSIDFDEKIFAEFHWCRAQLHPQENEKKITLVVAIQPHWVLDEHDMDQFVGCTAVRFFRATSIFKARTFFIKKTTIIVSYFFWWHELEPIGIGNK